VTPAEAATPRKAAREKLAIAKVEGERRESLSLDVYLTAARVVGKESGSGIFIRRNGQTEEITREEWDAAFPGREPMVVKRDESDSTRVFEANITHNLNQMAAAAGIYQPLWRPDEVGITKAQQLIEPLRAGLSLLRTDPAKFEALNPSNGWGSYADFVPWVERYLAACEEHPDANVTVSR
jgi:hypothetical protein